MTEILTEAEDSNAESDSGISQAREHDGDNQSSNTKNTSDSHVTVIESRSGWQLLDWKEMVEYRDLLRFLTWRLIKVRYAQSVLGIGWAVIQPVATMIVFTIVFGRLAKVSSDGVPYAVFSFVALVPWTYFSNALSEGVSSLVQNANMLSKIYFPRILLPVSAVAAKLLDFLISLFVLSGLMLWFGIVPTIQILWLPLLIALMIVTAVGFSIWLTALAIQYRDVKHGMSFGVQLLMYAAPVVYPASLIPSKYQYIYAINPMVGVIEGFRAALLDTRAMPWDFLAIGSVTSLALLVSGMIYFRRREPIFADVA